MGWQARLTLAYRREGATTVVLDRHDGPLRILKSLYPEGGAICHNVLVHPPGGIVGCDALDVAIELDAGTHALVTTPGATRFYRSVGAPASQTVELRARADSRFEWLPLETIAYSGCIGTSTVRLRLDAGAETIGRDIVALGLPAAGAPFARGRYAQSIELEGRWLERGTVAADDRRLLDSRLGWNRRPVLATMWFAAGAALDAARRDRLLDAARAVAGAHPLAASIGATSPDPAVVVVRALAPHVETANDLLARVWAAWREVGWNLAATAPRVWRT